MDPSWVSISIGTLINMLGHVGYNALALKRPDILPVATILNGELRVGQQVIHHGTGWNRGHGVGRVISVTPEKVVLRFRSDEDPLDMTVDVLRLEYLLRERQLEFTVTPNSVDAPIPSEVQRDDVMTLKRRYGNEFFNSVMASVNEEDRLKLEKDPISLNTLCASFQSASEKHKKDLRYLLQFLGLDRYLKLANNQEEGPGKSLKRAIDNLKAASEEVTDVAVREMAKDLKGKKVIDEWLGKLMEADRTEAAKFTARLSNGYCFAKLVGLSLSESKALRPKDLSTRTYVMET
jgi:hypothetical protein